MKFGRVQGAFAALVLATSLWGTTPAHAESIGEEESITSSSLSVVKKGMDLSDKYAVWVSSDEDKNQSIVLYSLDNEKGEKIADSSSSKSSPVTAGNYVAWIDYGRKDGDIYLYDISSKKNPVRVTESNFKAMSDDIQISENYLVWTDGRDKNIYAYDLAKGTTTQLSTKGKASHPAVSNSYAVWQDGRSGDSDIFYYDFKTKKEYLASKNSDNQTNPDIYDDVIVYEDDRNNLTEIYQYDISAGEESRVTKSKNSADNHKERPQVYGSKVIYRDNEELRIQSLSSSSYDEVNDSVSERFVSRINGKYVLYAVEGNSSASLYLYNIKEDESTPLGSQAGGEISSPAASDRYVVYLNEGKKQDQVVLYDVKSKVTSIISSSSEQPARPLVSNQFVVWYDRKKDELVSYNVKTGKKSSITSSDDTPSDEFYALHGQKLVWADENRKGGYKLMLTDLKTMKTTETESATSELRGLGLYDNRIIWADGKDDRIEIDSYDIDDEHTVTIKNRIKDIDGVSVGKNYAVWSEYVSGDWELYYYDYDRENVSQMYRYKESKDQRKPKMSGDIFVYADNQNVRDDDGFYYYLYDLESKSRVKYYPGDAGSPSEMAIGGNRVVWIDNRDSIPEVYMMPFDKPSDDSGEGNGDKYTDYNFKKVLQDGTLQDIIKENGNSFDGIYFVFMDGSTEEASVSMDDASEDFDGFIELIEGYGFENIFVRVYK